MGVLDYSTTPASNTAINGIGIQGTNQVLNFDNALRQLMADIAAGIVAGSFSAHGYVAKSAGYTVVAGDRGKVIDCTATLELDLTAAATLGAGFCFIVKANGGDVTLDPNSTENINGASTSYVIPNGRWALVACTGTAWHTVDNKTSISATSTDTLTNKTLTSPVITSPVITTPQINDTTADHQYVFAVSELAADRTVTLPLLTGNDEFVFKDHTQTLTNKTLNSPTIDAPSITNLDASATAKGIVELATTAEATTGTDTARAVTPAGLRAFADANVYSGSSASNTTFPIGSYLLLFGSGAELARSASVTPYLNSGDTKIYVGTSSGSAVSGTWRARGYAFGGDDICLIQRVA